MHRRHFLASLGGGLPLAGCVGSESPATPTAGETTTADATVTEAASTDRPAETTAGSEPLALGETAETADGRTVTVHAIRVQTIVFTRTVHTDPHVRPGKQFVVADVATSDRGLLGGLSLPADGQSVVTGPNDALVAPFGDPAGELLGFPVPAPLDVDRAAVVWNGEDGATARWPLGASHLDALGHPATFEVRAFDVPETVEDESTFAVTLSVENTGTGDGTFRAELGVTTLSDAPEIRVEVPVGETVTAERTVDPYYPEETEELTVRLNWDAGDLTRTTAITR